MVEVNKKRACIPKIKISETFEKITNPGRKRAYRIYDENGQAIADLLTGWNETLDLSKPYRYIDPEQPWKQRSFENCTAKELQILVVKDGKRVAPPQPLKEIQAFVKKQLQEEIWEEEQRFENPHRHFLDMSPSYYEMKMDLLCEAKENGTKK